MRKLWNLLVLACAAAFVATISCSSGDDDSNTTPTSTDTDTGSATSTDTNDNTDTSEPAGAGTSCADAFVLPLGETDKTATQYDLGAWNTAQYHLLKGAVAGAFVQLNTVANPDSNPKLTDTVISVYTADGKTLLATADDAVPRVSMDSELIYRVIADGDLCIKVEDWASWRAAADPTKTSYEYKLLAGVLDDAAAPASAEKEPNNSLATAQSMTFGLAYGALDGASDVDFRKFTVPSGVVMAQLWILPKGTGSSGKTGTEGHGSTLEVGVFSVTDTAGKVLSEIDPRNSGINLYIPVTAGAEVAFKVGRADGTTPGVNDFYAIKQYNVIAPTMMEAEQATAASNNTSATAEALKFQTSGTAQIAYFYGNLDPAGDLDFWSFSAKAGDKMELRCGAGRLGSGLVDAVFSIEKADGTVLQSETEDVTKDLNWFTDLNSQGSKPAVSIAEAGTYYLKVAAGSQSARVSSSFYLCNMSYVAAAK